MEWVLLVLTEEYAKLQTNDTTYVTSHDDDKKIMHRAGKKGKERRASAT